MPAFGNSGPWQNYVAYGIGQEQLSGMAHMTGYVNDGPMKSGINHGDPITGSHAAGVLLAALRYRRRTGKGMFVDVSQQESAVALIGGEVVGYQISGDEPERMGNHSPWYAPHNAYPCAGDDRWVTIAVTNDEQWRGLAEAMGMPELADDLRFSSNEDRLQQRGALDRIIAPWVADKDMWDVTRRLQDKGVPAGPVLRGPDLLENEHYVDRGTFNHVDHPRVGPKWYQGFAWRMSKTPGQIHWPAPTLGQHNRQVYSELLGLTGAEIDGLEAGGVIGTKPTGSRII
jgi:benzylsuccinate CoA-transferase BbsF subunit